MKTFKVGLRRWVLSNIAVKPRRRYIQFQRKKVLRPVTPVRRNGQDIRNFLIDRSSSTGQEQQRYSSPPQPTDRPPPGRQQGILSFFSPVCDTQCSDNVVSGKDVTSQLELCRRKKGDEPRISTLGPTQNIDWKKPTTSSFQLLAIVYEIKTLNFKLSGYIIFCWHESGDIFIVLIIHTTNTS